MPGLLGLRPMEHTAQEWIRLQLSRNLGWGQRSQCHVCLFQASQELSVLVPLLVAALLQTRTR